MAEQEKDRFTFDFAEGFIQFGIGWKSIIGLATLGFAAAAIIFVCRWHGG
jgi:hypothetical protein